MQESRNQIRARMLKNAASTWGYSENEAENSFDPVVAALLAACSVEVEKISGEIQGSRTRILERLARLLSPDVLTGALPAHAIASATPMDPYSEIDVTTQLYTSGKLPDALVPDSTVSTRIFFRPTSNFRLNRASVRFMAAGAHLYQIDGPLSKAIIARSTDRKLPASTLWLGIDEPDVSLHDTRFYFECRNEADSTLLYHYLPQAIWQCGGHQLRHVGGYGDLPISGEILDLEGICAGDSNVSNRLIKHVNAFYKRKFITLADPHGHTFNAERRTDGQSEIRSVFSSSTASKLSDGHPIRWLCLQFPEAVPDHILQDLGCTMNCFPVVNQQLNALNYRLQDTINIIPLRSEGFFVDIATVIDDAGRALSLQGSGSDASTALLMRNGGVGRFDERDAADTVDYLLQQLRDESPAFAGLGTDFMSTELKQLQQIMNKLEQRSIARGSDKGQAPYLVVRKNANANLHNLHVSYWSTNGAEGNYIAAGTVLESYNGGALQDNRAIMISASAGGRSTLSATDTSLAYKSALLTRDRIVTAEDVKAFCHSQLGERVTKIELRKGVMTHPSDRQGFLKSLDVHISIDREAYLEMKRSGEYGFWIEKLKIMLEEKSASFMPYRIQLESAS